MSTDIVQFITRKYTSYIYISGSPSKFSKTESNELLKINYKTLNYPRRHNFYVKSAGMEQFITKSVLPRIKTNSNGKLKVDIYNVYFKFQCPFLFQRAKRINKFNDFLQVNSRHTRTLEAKSRIYSIGIKQITQNEASINKLLVIF